MGRAGSLEGYFDIIEKKILCRAAKKNLCYFEITSSQNILVGTVLIPNTPIFESPLLHPCQQIMEPLPEQL